MHKIKSSRAVKQAKMEALGYPGCCFEKEITLGDFDKVTEYLNGKGG